MTDRHDPSPSDQHVAELFEQLAACSDDESAAQIRTQIATATMPVARHIARRFAHRGTDDEDLRQVAYVALLLAIDRFDPSRGSGFTAFAVPTILGEIKKYFRDHAWSARVPRRLKDLTVRINSVTDELTQRIGRAPTAAELAAELDIETSEVIEALAARSAYQPASLDSPIRSDEESSATLADTLGADDEALAKSDDYLALAPLLDTLPARERRIIVLRFVKERTQSEIAREVGVSQVQVSRLLTRTLAQLRLGLQA